MNSSAAPAVTYKRRNQRSHQPQIAAPFNECEKRPSSPKNAMPAGKRKKAAVPDSGPTHRAVSVAKPIVLQLTTPTAALVDALQTANLHDDLLLCSINATDVESLGRTTTTTKHNVSSHLRWLEHHPYEMQRSIARLGTLVATNILSYFRSSDAHLYDDIKLAAMSEVHCLMHNPAWVNSTIANAGFRLRRRVAGNTPFRSALEDDTTYELFVARAACMLGVALGEEADMFACGDQSWDQPVAIGVCDICNQNKVWANVPSDCRTFACCHCMCQECTEEVLSRGQPCPFCRTYDVWESGQRESKSRIN